MKKEIFAIAALAFSMGLMTSAWAERTLISEESYVRQTDAGTVQGSVVYEYDAFGVLTRYVDSSSVGGKQTIKTYKVAYDADGKRIDSGKEQHGYLLGNIEHEYDSEGREIHKISYSNVGALEQEEAWEYGIDGNLISYSFISPSAATGERYTYLPSGVLSSRVKEDASGALIEAYMLQEDISSDVIRVYVTKNSAGEVLQREEQNLNKDGNVIAWRVLNPSGEETAHGEYAYDLMGHRFYEVSYSRQEVIANNQDIIMQNTENKENSIDNKKEETENNEDKTDNIIYEDALDSYRFLTYDEDGRLIADELLDSSQLLSTTDYTYIVFED